MKNSIKCILALTLLCGSASARLSRDASFVRAVRDGDLEVVDRLFTCVTSTKTYDDALRAAARNSDCVLFNMIAPYASPRGLRKGQASLKRHMKVSRLKRVFAKRYNRSVYKA